MTVSVAIWVTTWEGDLWEMCFMCEHWHEGFGLAHHFEAYPRVGRGLGWKAVPTNQHRHHVGGWRR